MEQEQIGSSFGWDVKEVRNSYYAKALEDMFQAMAAPHVEATADTAIYIQNAIGTANFYGIETYWTMGAYLHIVQVMPGKKDFGNLLTIRHLYDSFLENYADVIKDVWHFRVHAGNDEINIWAYDQFVIESSKYLYRMLMARKAVYEALRGVDHDALKPLMTITRLEECVSSMVDNPDFKVLLDMYKDIRGRYIEVTDCPKMQSLVARLLHCYVLFDLHQGVIGPRVTDPTMDAAGQRLGFLSNIVSIKKLIDFIAADMVVAFSASDDWPDA
jgi:hypothetical protein